MSRFIEGERIYLRAITADDATDEYLSWLNDEETTRGLASGIFPSTRADLQSFVEKVQSNRNVVMFGLIYQKIV